MSANCHEQLTQTYTNYSNRPMCLHHVQMHSFKDIPQEESTLPAASYHVFLCPLTLHYNPRPRVEVQKNCDRGRCNTTLAKCSLQQHIFAFVKLRSHTFKSHIHTRRKERQQPKYYIKIYIYILYNLSL